MARRYHIVPGRRFVDCSCMWRDTERDYTIAERAFNGPRARQTHRDLRSLWAVYAICVIMATSLPACASGYMTQRGLKIATIGTSLTARGAWQAPLKMEMAACLGVPVMVTNRAKSGETSSWGLQNIGAVLSDRPGIVLIEFAANDAALSRFISLSRSVDNMRAIVAAIRAQNKDAIIIVQAMNPIFGFRRWIRPFLNHYIEAHLTLARELGLDFIDHRPLWARYSDTEIRQIIPDGAHPLPSHSAQMIAMHIKAWLVERYFPGRCF